MVAYRAGLVLVLAFAQTTPAASSSSLGLATSAGEFKLNGAQVRGNATLLEGTVVETLGTPSRLKFAGGSQLALHAGSRARVHAGRVVVEAGSGEFQAAADQTMALEALSLRVAAEGRAPSRARFAVAAGGTALQLSAASGRFRVMNAQGTLISRIDPGLALAFEPQAGAGPAMPSSFLGCVVNKDSKWMLYDPTVKLLVELRGQASLVEREWGNRVQANGTSPTAGQPQGRQVMDVTTITRVEVGGCEEMAQAAGAQLPARAPVAAPAAAPPVVSGGGGATSGGMSAGTKYGIIAGVIGGGAVAGIAAASGGDRSR
ncbi:MAG: hypothetical protein IT162_05055 [Bryobacterales bacterium]|nr:hypothetical protein [Bryobacterales bacterium]